jgi:hypothetical protein
VAERSGDTALDEGHIMDCLYYEDPKRRRRYALPAHSKDLLTWTLKRQQS